MIIFLNVDGIEKQNFIAVYIILKRTRFFSEQQLTLFELFVERIQAIIIH